MPDAPPLHEESDEFRVGPASGNGHVLWQLGLGHVRVILVEALHDARFQRGWQLSAELTQELWRSYQNEATKASLLSCCLQLTDD